jgi:hypothetical protein
MAKNNDIHDILPVFVPCLSEEKKGDIEIGSARLSVRHTLVSGS